MNHGGGCVMAWACMAASGVGFIDDVTHDSNSRMNSEIQQDNDPKHTANTTKDCL